MDQVHGKHTRVEIEEETVIEGMLMNQLPAALGGVAASTGE